MNFSKNGIKLTSDNLHDDYELKVKQLHFPANTPISVEKQVSRIEDVYMTDPFNIQINMNLTRDIKSNFVKFILPMESIPFSVDIIFCEVNRNTSHTSKAVNLNRIDYSNYCVRVYQQLFMGGNLACFQFYLDQNRNIQIGLHLDDRPFNNILDSITLDNSFRITFIGGYIAGY